MIFMSYRVSVHRFRVQRSAPPLATEVASLIKKVTLALPSHIRGLGIRTKLKARSPRKKCWFCHIIAKYHVPDPPASPVMYRTGISQEVGNGGQVCGDVEAVGFHVQNVYKMTYGDKNATFEPVNGYLIVYQICLLRTITYSIQFVSIQSGFIRPQALDTTVIE
jgi:hypothetical protein